MRNWHIPAQEAAKQREEQRHDPEGKWVKGPKGIRKPTLGEVLFFGVALALVANTLSS